MRILLLALNATDGLPMPESALVSAVQVGARPDEPTWSDVKEAIRDAEAEQWICGVDDRLTGRTWTLTEKGTHRARKL